MDPVEQVLEHYGTKGMKWGVRKKHSAPSGPTPVTVKTTPGKRVKTAGGTHQGPHNDAVTAAISRQKAHKSSTDSLSNAELKALVARMQMERQYSQLAVARQNKAKKFAFGLLGSVGKQQATAAANQVAAQQVAKVLAKKAAGV